MPQNHILWFNQISMKDLAVVGGKNASLGEMLNQLSRVGLQVPNGFATTAQTYYDFLEHNGLNPKINQALQGLNTDDVHQLAQTGKQIREWILQAPFSADFEAELKQAWLELCQEAGGDQNQFAVAVRSSATAEDLPEASFAGQQETFLNVRGFDQVLHAIKEVFASLFNDRAIAYRVHQGFHNQPIALSAGIQHMARSDLGSSGVMFTLDTESGFEDVILITSAYGLGETVVQGAVNPDEFYVYKPALAENRPAILSRHLGSKRIKMVYAEGNHSKRVETVPVAEQEQFRFSLTDQDIEFLARQAMLIEQHYGRPMDIEWAKDGNTGQLYILQARPETVQSRQQQQCLERYVLQQKSEVIIQGRSVGQKIARGVAKVIQSVEEMHLIEPGDVLVTDMTDPDWEPIMKRAAAIVTNRGGRTCHAAIIARELGIPAIVGCGQATRQIKTGDAVTVSCAEGDTGFVYRGLLDFDIHRFDMQNLQTLPVKISLNVGNPERAFAFRHVPNSGVGLARLEFIISAMIGVHPKALLDFANLPAELKLEISKKTSAYASPTEFYISKLQEGIATIAAAFYPNPVIVRLSDFKSNEYANLLGGHLYEPQEENPMIGYRGASRYVEQDFQPCFAMECQAIKRVREQMGLANVQVMVPFVRTVIEAEQVIQVLEQFGLVRGQHDLKIIMMCEIPANALLADQFLQYFDGFSIGSNDLTQLTLGLDRDSGLVAKQFDERNDAVKALFRQAIQACKKAGKYSGICGQGPSDYPDFAEWLIAEGIESISLNPDSVLATYFYLLNYIKK